MDDITIVNSNMSSAASTLQNRCARPPLPPATRSPMSLRQDDLIQLRQKHKLKSMNSNYMNSASNSCDVAVIYSSRCQVSGEWAQFISALMKQQGHKEVTLQCIESDLLGELFSNFCQNISERCSN